MVKYSLFLFILINLFPQNKPAWNKNKYLIKTDTKDTTIMAVNYPNGISKRYSVANYTSSTDFTYPDSTIIDFNGIDTTLYNKKYSYWNYVPLGDAPGPLVAGDINKDGRGELYGEKVNTSSPYSKYVYAFVLNNIGKFDSSYRYDSTIFARNIFDINNDGIEELYVVGHYIIPIDSVLGMQVNRNLIYTETSNQSIPQTLSFIFDPYRTNNSQQDCNVWGKFDNDQYPSEVFH